MAAHSQLGASSARRWMTCPGSFVLADADGVQRPGSSVYAAAGTVAHTVAEWALEDPKHKLQDRMGEFVQCQGHEIVIDGEMLTAVRVYLDAIQERQHRGSIVRHEARVDLARWWQGEPPPPTPMFGTADTWIYSQATQRLTIIDFKYGSGVYVTVQDNPQLLYYAAGVLASIPYPIRDIEIVVVQPRARGVEPIRSDTIDVLDLRIWIDFQLKPAVAAVSQPNARLQTGTHCRFCPARPGCPAYADRAQEQARADFADTPMPMLLGLS